MPLRNNHMKHRPIHLTALLLAALTAAQRVQGAGPKLFWGSDPIRPGETAMLYGDGIGPKVAAEAWRPDDVIVSAPPDHPEPWMPTAPGSALRVLQASDKCAKVALPEEFKAGIFAVRLKTGEGDSEPYFLNRTEPWWWLGGENDQAYAGEELRVFGKNFGEQTRAWLAGTGGHAVELKILQAGKYSVRCQLPKDIKPGTYALWLHNGFGGKPGFGNPLTVPVAQREPWPTKRFDVREFGAKADGTADDTWAIQSALAAAEKTGGGTVYLPRGTYKITGKLIIPAKTTLKGDSRETACLMVPWNNQADLDSVIAGDGDFTVEDLTCVAVTARRMISCPLRPANDDTVSFALSISKLSEAEMGHNVRLRRLCLRHLRRGLGVGQFPALAKGWAVGFIGHDLEVSDCDIVSSDGAVNVHGRHLVVERNRFASASRFQDVEESVFAENTIRDADMDNTGNCFEGKAYRLHIAGNHISDIYGWDREAITFDVPYGHNWMGQVKMTNPVVMTLQGGPADSWGRALQPGALKGQGVMIVSGKGLGQFIPVTGNNGREITLERPWVIEPDATSWVVIRVIKNQVVLEGNRIEDAGEAIQLYANSYGFIIDGNTSKRAGGMYGASRDYLRGGTRRCYSSCAFNQWINNTLGEGFVYSRGYALGNGHLGPLTSNSNLTDPVTVSAMANVVRNNTVSGDINVGAGRGIEIAPRPSLIDGRDTLIEGNRISDTPGSNANVSRGGLQGLVVSSSFQDTVLRNNRVAPCPLPLRDDGKNTWINPVERLGYQLDAVKAVLGNSAALEEIRKEMASLEGKPDNQELQPACQRLHERLWAAVARQSPRVSADLLGSLVGLRFVVDPKSPLFAAVKGGKAGQAALAVQVRTEPWSPKLQANAALIPWAGTSKPASVVLQPDVMQWLRCNATVPPSAGIGALPLQLTVTLGNVPLIVKEPILFNRLELGNWLAAVSGTEGGWRPCLSTGGDQDLRRILGDKNPAVSLATGIEAGEKVSALLDLGYPAGQAEFFLNNKSIAALSQQTMGGTGKLLNARTVRVTLEKGGNLLMCKAAAGGDPEVAPVWTLRATVVTDPEEKRFVPVRELTPQQVQSLPQLRQGDAWAAAAGTQTLDDFENGSTGDWKFQPGPCQHYQVADSGERARGKVLRRDMEFVWDKAPAQLYRDLKPGMLAAASYGGLRVWMKADQPAFVDLNLEAGNQRFGARVSVGTEWREHRVPFEKFVKTGPGGDAITANELKRVNRLVVVPRNDDWAFRNLTLYIDDLGLLKK